jgi:hypothetical protein
LLGGMGAPHLFDALICLVPIRAAVLLRHFANLGITISCAETELSFGAARLLKPCYDLIILNEDFVMGQSTPINKHPSIPHVLCPRCGKHMRLAEIDPGSKAGEEIMKFDCECAFEFKMSRAVKESLSENARHSQTPRRNN